MAFGRATSDTVGGSLGILLGVPYLTLALRMPFWTVGGNPGAGFLPTLLGSGFMAVSLSLLIKAFGERVPASTTGVPSQQYIQRPRYVLLSLIGYIFLFPLVNNGLKFSKNNGLKFIR